MNLLPASEINKKGLKTWKTKQWLKDIYPSFPLAKS